jgi:uncharacterized protein YoxC
MRARRREINIFNMSLLDILCGALGAFCFMMIVALPYYIPPGSGLELRKAQEETERLLLAIGNLKERMPDQKSIEEMEKLLRELEAQVKALQGRVNILTVKNEELREQIGQLTAAKEQLQAQVNQLAAEKEQLQGQVNQLTAEKQQLQVTNQQLQAKNEELAKANNELARRLQERKPFTLLARADEILQTIEIILMNKTASEKAGQNFAPNFNAWLSGKLDVFNQVQAGLLFGRGIATGMVADVPLGTQYKIYMRLANVPDRRQSTVIDSALFGNEMQQPPTRLPKVTLSPERFWTLLGTITIDPSYRPIFKEATAQERDAEWQAMTTSTPPPTPTPRPTLAPPSAAELEAAAATRAKRQEFSKKFHRLMELTHQQPSESNDAQILTLSEELLKELPPKDGMRRQVESTRERFLAEKSRRRTGVQQPPGATPAPSPPPRRQLSPVPSPTP